MTRAEQLKSKKFIETEWKKIYYENQTHYIRKRLLAIKYLYEGKSREEVMKKVNCVHQSLTNWVDTYLEKGLEGLVTPKRFINRKQSLNPEQKKELLNMMLKEKPTDYGIDRNIWTGKILEEVIFKKWKVKLKDSRIYKILEELGLSHQKAHRDYENADPELQARFVSEVKKN